MTSPRSTASDRRAQVRAIAAEEFAAHGLHGASTETIARRAGISQSYVFRLFGTKRALFCEAVGEAFDRTTEGMRSAAGDLRGPEALSAMATAYLDLLRDPVTLQLQHQGFAAASEPDVRRTVQGAFGRVWETVAELSGQDAVGVTTFVAVGMLQNALVAIDVDHLDAPWARAARTRIPFDG